MSGEFPDLTGTEVTSSEQLIKFKSRGAKKTSKKKTQVGVKMSDSGGKEVEAPATRKNSRLKQGANISAKKKKLDDKGRQTKPLDKSTGVRGGHTGESSGSDAGMTSGESAGDESEEEEVTDGGGSSTGGPSQPGTSATCEPLFKKGTEYYKRSIKSLVAQGKRVGIIVSVSKIRSKEDFDKYNEKILRAKEKRNEFEIKCIINHAMVKDGRRKYRKYKVLFKDDSTEWCNAAQINESAKEAVQVYRAKRNEHGNGFNWNRVLKNKDIANM